MDPLKLLSRATKVSKRTTQGQPQSIPSNGQNAQPQLFGDAGPRATQSSKFRKRKRGQNDLSGLGIVGENAKYESASSDGEVTVNEGKHEAAATCPTQQSPPANASTATLPIEQRRAVLKEHKVKVTWLITRSRAKQDKRRAKKPCDNEKNKHQLFPEPLQSFDRLSARHGISKRLVRNVLDQGFMISTEVQLAALPLLLDEPAKYLAENGDPNVDVGETTKAVDLLAVAPTGSGKTLAFLIPLLHVLNEQKRDEDNTPRRTASLILAPTRELAGQIVNEGRKLTKGTVIGITQMRKGMQFSTISTTAKEHNDEDQHHASVVKADIVVSTPGVLQSALHIAQNKTSMSHIRHLILDEADVLLDPLFRDQTLEIWNTLTNPDLRVSMWSATIGSNIEELIKSTIDGRRQRLNAEKNAPTPEAPLIRLIVGLKDSAVPNVQHKLTYAATEQGKLMGLRQILHPTKSVDSGPPLRPPFLVFTQTIERAVALHAELLYDIPAEAGGISRIAVLHADLSDAVRDSVMTRFRKGEIWILITTDLLSRGVDFRGVNGVVNYDIPTSSAAYVHRIGRTGRAGRAGGVAVTLYSKEDIPYMKHVINVVAMVQKQKGETHTVQQWLLDALPKLSKNEKQNLRRHGIESRTAKGRQKNPKAARKARISTKAGFVRQAENKRIGAILGSQRRVAATADSDGGDETDFGGFD